MIPQYPFVEGLVVFAVVFLIGFLCARSNRGYCPFAVRKDNYR